MNPYFKTLVKAAAAPYRTAGKYAWYFARGKLGGDPVFHYLIRHGLLPDRGRLFDLGCGQGVLMALLHAAKERFAAGQWPANWPEPPGNLHLHGIELRTDRAAVARLALGDAASVETRDIRVVSLPACAVITILDVLLYLDREAQRAVLEQCAHALAPGGLLVLREANAGRGLAFAMTRWAERVACWARGQFGQALVYRRAEEWNTLLAGLGFSVSAVPMSAGTPFANVLFLARRQG